MASPTEIEGTSCIPTDGAKGMLRSDSMILVLRLTEAREEVSVRFNEIERGRTHLMFSRYSGEF